MATRRTNEEKLKLISDYEASGLSMTEYCNVNYSSQSLAYVMNHTKLY